MATMLEAAIARVHGAQGRVVGGGFLVEPDKVVTCAHVVARALGLADDEPPPAQAEVRLDFPLVAPGELVTARVELWQAPQADNTGDVAGLRLAGTAPGGATATRLVTADDLWSHPFRAFGFPAAHDQGVWVSGRLRGRQAAGWVQMDGAAATGYRVEPGFSGTPVWDDELDGVVGMAVAAEARPEVRAAYLIPTSALVRAWPGLGDQARPPCPYRGLFAFRERDAALFFGREEAGDQLLGELTRHQLVAVAGPSGSGKSSLVFAGVVPRLRQRQGWVVLPMRPAQASSPFTALAAALQPVLEPEMSETQRLQELASLEAVLAQGRLPQVVDRALARTGGEQLLLVIDQCEELYALDPAVARQFLDAVVAAAVPGGRPRPLTILLTLRSDFLGQALEHAGLARLLGDATFLIGQMTRDQLRQVITGPLAGGTSFEAGLVERILDDVGEEPGNLPLLEFALTLLWDRQEHGTLTHAGYEALGGVDGAIARYAEQVYLEELSEADREIAPRLLVQLVEPTQAAAPVRRVARRTELDPARWQLAQRLATARLLVAGRDPAEVETVELVHEALIEHWDRLREWAEADRSFRAWQERLRGNIAAWQDSGHDTGALLRGGPLGEAEGWLQQRAEDLVPAERDFITASRAFQGRSLRRLRALSAGLAVLLVAALVFGVLTVQANQRAEEQSRRATSAYLVARAEAFEETRPDLALLLSVAALRVKDTPEATDRLARMASDRRDAQALLATGGGAAVAVAFNPADGRMLVSAGADAIAFWDAERRAQVGKVAARGVSEFAWSPDGRVLASGGSLDEVQLWDPLRRRELEQPLTEAPDDLGGLTFSPDGRLLAACGSGEIVLWDLQKRTVPDAISIDESPYDCRAGFTAGGRQLVYADGGSIITWDIGRRRVHRADLVPYLPDDPAEGGEDQERPAVTSFTPSPDGTTALVTTNRVDLPMLWDLRRAARLTSLPHDVNFVNEVTFSQNGRALAIATETSTQVLEVTGLVPGRVFTGHKGDVLSAALSPDGRTLAAGGEDGTIALFQADSLGALPASPVDAAFRGDGGQLLTASFEEGMQAWDVARRAKLGPSTPLARDPERDGPVAFSQDGRLLATRPRLEDVVVWDVERRRPLDGPIDGSGARTLAFSPDGRTLAWADLGGDVTVWDVASRKVTATLSLDRPDSHTSLSFSADGRRLAVATDGPNGTIVLWDIADEPPAEPWVEGNNDWVNPAFSPDGRWLAVESSSGVELFDVQARRLVDTLGRHSDAVFSPDSRFLATSVGTSEVAIWRVADRIRIATLDVGVASEPLRFSPDSQLLAASGGDILTLQRFDAPWAARHICAILGRDLTRQEWNDHVRGRDYQPVCS